MTQIDTLTDVLKSRYSCRAFRPDPVPDDKISQIVAAARHAPSWCNAQPWQVAITKGDATDRFRNALAAQVDMGLPSNPDLDWPTSYTGVYNDRRRACGYQLYEAAGIARSDVERRQAQMRRNYALFDAPHVAIVSTPAELGAYGAMDSGGFVTAFTLAATALGVATIAQAAIAAYAPTVREHFGIADTRLILCAISFGYPDADAAVNQFRTARASPSDITDWHS